MLMPIFHKINAAAQAGGAYDTGCAFVDCSGVSRTVISAPGAFDNNHNICNAMKTPRTSYSSYGVVFGNGTGAVTEGDYKLSGNIITTLSTTYSNSVEFDDDGYTITTKYNLTNTGTSDVTISEIGLFISVKYAGSYSTATLIERTLLDSPITIPAGDVGQITYTIRINYPTT